MGNFLRTFLLLVLTAALWGGAACRASETFIVAVVPQFAPTQIYRDWTPLLTHLEQVTGYHFQLRVYDQIPRFEAELAQGIPDLVFMNPYHMVLAKQAHAYRPLVRDSTTLSGILVVRRNGAVKALADLNGQTLSFPAPNALGASLYLRALLAEKEGLKINPVYVGNHQNVYRQVLRGEVAAGGGVRKTFDKEAESVRAQLQILYSTPELAPHPLAAHPRVALAASKKIVEALLAMRLNPSGSMLLAGIQMPRPIEADFQRDYEPLVRLKLDRYAIHSGQ